MVMIPTCSSPLIAVGVTTAEITAGFRDVSVRHQHRQKSWPSLNALVNMPVIIPDGVEFGPLHLASGLTQGCPASCMLCIIGVDPLLSSLQQTPRLSGVSGFVDDWIMGCQGMPAISAVSILTLCFEQTSGQKNLSWKICSNSSQTFV